MNATGQYQMRPVPVSAKRCEHGFLGGAECQECDPSLLCCALCGSTEHEAKLCSETAVGRSRRAALREEKKRNRRNQARRERRKANRIGSDISCPTQGSSDPASAGRGDA